MLNYNIFDKDLLTKIQKSNLKLADCIKKHFEEEKLKKKQGKVPDMISAYPVTF